MAFSLTAPPALVTRNQTPCLLAVLLLTLWLGGCANIDAFDRGPAVQSHHSDGVPYVTDVGGVSLAPHTGGGKVQRVLYHALAGHLNGRNYSLEFVRRAGFTAVHPWEGQDIASFLNAARAVELGVVPHNPNDDIVFNADRSGVLAWYLHEEPTLRFPPEQQSELLENFRNRREELRAIDPKRPVFALLGPPLDRVRPLWDQWAKEGDLSVHDNYAVHDRISEFSNPVRHVARSVSFTRSLIPSDRPLWFVIQAFSSEDRGWMMPTPHEYRGMAMAALIHGASGLVTFAFDSFVTRDDQVLGIAPEPMSNYGAELPDYNGDGKAHRIATDSELSQSILLWNSVASFNRYLEKVDRLLLLPNQSGELTVIAPAADGLDNPVRVALKRDGDKLYAFVVNLLSRQVDAEFRLETIGAAAELESSYPYGPQRQRSILNGTWQDSIEPLGVRVYRISDG